MTEKEKPDLKVEPKPDPRHAQLQDLQMELSNRANQLVSQDPLGCRILGKMEVLQEQLKE